MSDKSKNNRDIQSPPLQGDEPEVKSKAPFRGLGVDDLLTENTRRQAAINHPYDPVTGEGCNGERKRFCIEDAPFSALYLPRPMMDEPVCKALSENGSIKKLFVDNGWQLGEEEYNQFWIAFCELRIKYDFEFFAIMYIHIRDKITGNDIPFRLNRGQRRLLAALEDMRLAEVPIRIMVLKARQWGGSTLIQLYMFWIQLVHRRNWNSVICAHVKDASKTIRAMFERAITRMIPIDGVSYTIKNYQSTQNIKEVPQRGCTITVGTAIEPDSVRSQDAKMVHFSEQAFYPDTDNNRTEDLETSIVGSVPAEPYTMVARETTANGVGDYFHTEWEKAKRGETAYRAVFVEWFLIDIYSKPFDGYYYNHSGKKTKGTIDDFAATLGEYELNLFRNKPECTLENLNWRRLKLSEMSSEAKMKQEYPSDDIEAFQDSGEPVFRADEVESLRKDCREPQAIGVLVSDCLPAQAKLDPKQRRQVLANIRFVADEEALAAVRTSDARLRARKEENRLKVYEYPDTAELVSNRYVVVYDPQKGISDKADWGVITVLDRYWMMHGGVPEVVAEWRGHTDKDIAIWISAQIATYYNRALLVIESNTFESDYSRYDESEFIFDTIAGAYDNLYSRTPADKINEGVPAVYGFHTNRSTKVLIVNNFVAVIRESGYIERVHEALNEARVYEKKKTGAFGAKEGHHDDRLITRMIGCYICYEMDMPRVIDREKKMKSDSRRRSEACI